jgi:hypothetical protein
MKRLFFGTAHYVLARKTLVLLLVKNFLCKSFNFVSFKKCINGEAPTPGVTKIEGFILRAMHRVGNVHIDINQRNPTVRAAVEAEMVVYFGKAVFEGSKDVQQVASDPSNTQQLEASVIAAATISALDKVQEAHSLFKAGLAAGKVSDIFVNAISRVVGDANPQSITTEKGLQQLVQTGNDENTATGGYQLCA